VLHIVKINPKSLQIFAWLDKDIYIKA